MPGGEGGEWAGEPRGVSDVLREEKPQGCSHGDSALNPGASELNSSCWSYSWDTDSARPAPQRGRGRLRLLKGPPLLGACGLLITTHFRSFKQVDAA